MSAGEGTGWLVPNRMSPAAQAATPAVRSRHAEPGSGRVARSATTITNVVATATPS